MNCSLGQSYSFAATYSLGSHLVPSQNRSSIVSLRFDSFVCRTFSRRRFALLTSPMIEFSFENSGSGSGIVSSLAFSVSLFFVTVLSCFRTRFFFFSAALCGPSAPASPFCVAFGSFSWLSLPRSSRSLAVCGNGRSVTVRKWSELLETHI